MAKKNLSQLQKIEVDVFSLISEVVANNGGRVKNLKSQIWQDFFVLHTLQWKKMVFFVEFGATNGCDLNNTYLLEKDFGWKGILAEPEKIWHEYLRSNGSISIDHDCVWRESGKVIDFMAPSEAEYSTLSCFTHQDIHPATHNKASIFPVNTVSLVDLLKRHNSPPKINYLSMDTEGNEFHILEAFDFDESAISVIICEHNVSSQRNKINELLISRYFIRVFDGFSHWDSWYVNPHDIANNSTHNS